MYTEPTLPSDITYERYQAQYEKYQFAHNGYGQYLSYELDRSDRKLKIATGVIRDFLADRSPPWDKTDFFNVFREAIKKIEEV